MQPADQDLRRLRARLCEEASLFDCPDTYIAGVQDALAAVVGLAEAPPETVYPRLATASSAHQHLVEFYENDDFLVDSVVQFLAPALQAQDAAVVVASRQHREKFEAAPAAAGLDVAGARERTHFVTLDAAQTLSAFLADGTPDPGRFRTVLGGLIDRAAEGGRSVRMYGEMAALLWEKGNSSAALTLEDLWTELAESHAFSLLCAYPMGSFDRQECTAAFRTVCHQHSAVIPSESYSKLPDPDDRLRAVALLQQEARAGVCERTALRRRQDELEAALGRLRDLDRRIEFVAMLVHDMRTPATVISELLRFLQESWTKLDEDEIHEFLTAATENIKQIERHVGDLLLALWFSAFLLE